MRRRVNATQAMRNMELLNRIHALEFAVELLENLTKADHAALAETIDRLDSAGIPRLPAGFLRNVPIPDRITGFAAGTRYFTEYPGRPLMECWKLALDHARQHLPAEEVYAECANGSRFKALLVVDPRGDFFANADQFARVKR